MTVGGYVVINPDKSFLQSAIVAASGSEETSDTSLQILLTLPIITQANRFLIIETSFNGWGKETDLIFQLQVDSVIIRDGKLATLEPNPRYSCFGFSERVAIPVAGLHTIDFLWASVVGNSIGISNGGFATLRASEVAG